MSADRTVERHRQLEVVTSTCRICTNLCPITVDVDEGRVVRIAGDKAAPLYEGYTCVKGRAQGTFLRHPNRVLHTLRRQDDDLVAVPPAEAVHEIATQLAEIVERHGPRAVAYYQGNGSIASTGTGSPLAHAFMAGLGSPMVFNAATIDKPGKQIAKALHGRWMAPSQGFDRPDVALLIGINPLVTYTGFPNGNPGRWLASAQDTGMKLLVIDPRQSDVARRASIHLQVRPGTDVPVLAAIIRVVIAEVLYDAEFVAEHADGLDQLSAAVAPFTPELVAELAGVDPTDLVEAARIFGRATRGYVMAGTGPAMSGPGTLLEYLVLDLETICGHWLRQGEVVPNPGVLIPRGRYVAQAQSPTPARFGEHLRVRGLTNTPAGMPTSALADEILCPGEGQVRALISSGGNPIASWPNQLKVIDAMRSLDLLVQIDPWMSQTARVADYVIGVKMPLEVASTTSTLEVMTQLGTGYGGNIPYAQFSPPVVPPPDDSELVEEWEFFFDLAAAMGVPLRVPVGGWSIGGSAASPRPVLELDPAARPTTEELIEWLTEGSRVPLQVVKAHPHGGIFRDDSIVVEPREPGWDGRFDLADAQMMTALAELSRPVAAVTAGYPFRLLCRRMMHVYNSSGNVDAVNHGRPYNPAFMNPDDIDGLELVDGAHVRITSAAGSIPAVVKADKHVRRSCISMSFGFGDGPERDHEFLLLGSSTSRLVNDEIEYDPYSGQPRMSNIPVQVSPLR